MIKLVIQQEHTFSLVFLTYLTDIVFYVNSLYAILILQMTIITLEKVTYA